MTKEDILKYLNNVLDKINESKQYEIKTMVYINNQEHMAISEIRNKLIPIKPDDVFVDFDGSLLLGWCPKCDHPVDSNQPHCPKCLQAFDWSE